MSHPAWQRWRWTAAAAAAVLVGLTGLAAHGELWDWLGVLHMKPYFADLAAVLAAGQAKMAGRDVYLPNDFDPFRRPHVYGPLWLVTGPLGLTAGDALWLGALLALAFLFVALVLAAPRTPAAAALTVAVLLSPPVLLGVERGNNDLIIFLLVAAAGWAVARQSAARQAAGAGLLVLAAALKYYPLAAVPALAARPGRIRTLAALGVTCGLVFAALFWWQREDFSRAMAITPRPTTIFAYGFSILGYSWTSLAMHRFWHVAGFLVGVALAAGALWPARRSLLGSIPLLGGRAFCAAAGAAMWVFCYFANMNYPYRTVLLLLVLPCWLPRSGDAEPARVRVGLLFAVALWLAMPKSLWADLYQMGGPGAGRAASWLVGVYGVEQALWLALTLATGAMLGGWAWRRWQAGPL